MANLLRDQLAGWPPELDVFDPARWGPVPGATLMACRCAPCVARWGEALPPDDAVSVSAARRRWGAARVEFLRERLGKDHPATRAEAFAAVCRESRRDGPDAVGPQR